MNQTAFRDEDHDAPPWMAADRPSLWVAAAVQDHLLTASNDLDRLQALLAHACDTLMERFCNASEQVGVLLSTAQSAAPPAGGSAATGIEALQQQLRAAVTALQFQDMASQLIAHTHRRLRSCADQLAHQAFGTDDDDGDTVIEQAPERPNPVTQDEMDAGAIELF